MKFCCDRFKSYHENCGNNGESDSERETYPNIKIVKLKADLINGGKNLYRYLILCGFTKDNPPYIVLKYCPFCGNNLFDFYRSDAYVNADSSTFFE